MIASVATAFAELLGGAIGLNILFKIPIKIGTLIMLAGIIIFTFSNAYNRIEKIIISFVSIIGFSFIFEMTFLDNDWPQILKDSVVVNIPEGALFSILAVLGSVVMPLNLYLHS